MPNFSTKIVAPPGERPMYLVKTNGRKINMGMLPHSASVSAGQNLARLQRPGRLDIIRPMGRTNREISFEQVLTSGTGRHSVEARINQFRKLVESGARVKITGGSWASENGRWYTIASLEVTPERRSSINNYSRATLSWKFVEFSDATVKVLTKKKKTSTSKSRKKSAPKKAIKGKKSKYTTYKIKRGDNLSKIAKKYLGSANKWRSIWQANKKTIKNPNRLVVGKKIKIPRK